MKKKQRNIIIILILLFTMSIISIQIIPFASSGDYNGLPEPTYDELYSPSTPILNSIDPDSCLDGSVELSWSESTTPEGVVNPVFYIIYRMKDFDSWEFLTSLIGRSHIDLISIIEGEYHEYRYVVIARYVYVEHFDVKCYDSQYSYIQFIAIGELNPLTDPSIIINFGASTTNTYDVILILYCDNDPEAMSFKLSLDSVWTAWESYSTTKNVTLPESSIYNPNYTVGVKYKKNSWESEPVYDDITYDPEASPPNGDGKPTDYTLLYVLLGVLGGLIGIGVFLKYRKPK